MNGVNDPNRDRQAQEAADSFIRGDYARAETLFAALLQNQPGVPEWLEALATARANQIAEIHVHVPPPVHFDKAALLAPAGSFDLPRPHAKRRDKPIERVRIAIGVFLGAGATLVMNGVTHAWGTIVGYRDRVWTNWYRRGRLFGILTLAYMREELDRRNLIDVYPKGTLTGFQPTSFSPPLGATHFRTADGTWNNLSNPKEGAAGTRFLRNVAWSAIRPETGARLLTPNPREISRELLTRTEPMKKVPFLNLLAASWIQFQNHDWVSHGEVFVDEAPYEIPLAADDPTRLKYRQGVMRVGRTQPDPTRGAAGGSEPAATYINEVTHWWDGSQIYGSDLETQRRLRSRVDGKLTLDAHGFLPVALDGVEDTGFRRNWWIGLTMLHTLFVKEHNAICDELKTAYPHWDDDHLFNVARLVNAAVMAKIHSVEWTPAILPNPTLQDGLNANWYGLLTNLFEYGKHRSTIGNINVRNPELGGVVGNPINRHGAPYGLTEEFTEVYRLHSLLPEDLELRRIGQNAAAPENVHLPETRQAGSRKLLARYGLADLFYSFGKQQPGQLVLNNFPRFMQEMSIPDNPVFDMGAVDILRARERGVPRYNEFRRQLGLNPIQSFDDLTNDKAVVARLRAVYGSDPDPIEDLDLLIGTLSEGTENRPAGFGFGETLFQIFILNASRRLQADRFYSTDYDEDTYTIEGLRWIDAATFKNVLLRHYPALAATGLANVTNAFEPWDDDERLSKERHPLRAYDEELQPDPWLGDRSR